MTDDTRERFLRAITAQVPADQIAEVHLFRPLRRGGTETGVAVIAAEHADMALASDGPSPVAASAVSIAAPVAEDSTIAEEEQGPYADMPAPTQSDDVEIDAHVALEDATASAADLPPQRHTVFTARYRLTLKGAERGKWEFDVVADADAPLGTVDTVVRGVLRRAGDEEEPERLTADGVRAALDGQSWRPTA